MYAESFIPKAGRLQWCDVDCKQKVGERRLRWLIRARVLPLTDRVVSEGPHGGRELLQDVFWLPLPQRGTHSPPCPSNFYFKFGGWNIEQKEVERRGGWWSFLTLAKLGAATHSAPRKAPRQAKKFPASGPRPLNVNPSHPAPPRFKTPSPRFVPGLSFFIFLSLLFCFDSRLF